MSFGPSASAYLKRLAVLAAKRRHPEAELQAFGKRPRLSLDTGRLAVHSSVASRRRSGPFDPMHRKHLSALDGATQDFEKPGKGPDTHRPKRSERCACGAFLSVFNEDDECAPCSRRKEDEAFARELAEWTELGCCEAMAYNGRRCRKPKAGDSRFCSAHYQEELAELMAA